MIRLRVASALPVAALVFSTGCAGPAGSLGTTPGAHDDGFQASALQGAWLAREYVLASGARHPLRGQILFDRSRWTVLFFVLDSGSEPARASAEGGSYVVRADSVVFTHVYHYSSGRALDGLPEASLRMVARDGTGPTEPTRFAVTGDDMTLFFPSGNRMTFVRAAAANGLERTRVLTAVQDLFDAMQRADRERIAQLFVPGATLFAIGPDFAAPPRRTTDEEFREAMDRPGAFLERMWSPEVRIAGNLAQVWTPYDFYRSGRFSHCGVDAFHLVKHEGEWRITAITYTVQGAECPPSPLGAPSGGR